MRAWFAVAVLGLGVMTGAAPSAWAGQKLPPAPATPAAPAESVIAQASGTAPLDTSARQVFLVEAATGTPLYAKNADERMPTSSMSKVMSMYMVFEAMKNGKLNLDSYVTVSEQAWRQEGSRTFLNLGEQARVEDLIRGVIIQSGNDAAVALAEAVSGSEGSFAGQMNERAKQLGMHESHFMNATGLPDPDHYATARDLTIMAMALMRDYPQHYHYYSETEFTHNKIKQGNRNPLLYRGIGVDGMKTGHTEAAGYGLIASALRDGRRLIAVVNGLPSMQARADETAKILDWGYREYGLYTVAKQGEQLAEANVWLGKAPTVPVTAAQDVAVSLPRPARAGLAVQLSYDQPITAPIAAGQVLGKATITAPGIAPIEMPLVAGQAVERLGFWGRLNAKIGQLFGRKP